MDPVIRRATIDDAEALFGLAEAFAISFKPARDAFQRSLSELLGDDSVWLAVAEWRGTVAGYCLGFDHYTFYANGREAFEHWAASRGSKLVGLATRRAAAFYSALGYESSAVFFRKLL
jgi:hypothetical protein